jgi:hypothetical protein
LPGPIFGGMTQTLISMCGTIRTFTWVGLRPLDRINFERKSFETARLQIHENMDLMGYLVIDILAYYAFY